VSEALQPRLWSVADERVGPKSEVEWFKFLTRRPSLEARPRGTIRFADLFSGIGGLSLGASLAIEDAGFGARSVLACDLDPVALSVYAQNLPSPLTIEESVADHVEYVVRGAGEKARFDGPPRAKSQVIGDFHGAVELLLAGPPCQGHSALNNHTRHDDPRNGLYLAVPALAIALGVPNVVIENVPGVVRDRNGVVQTAATLLREGGYQVEMGVLRADKIGWPQTRSRFFMVASRWGAPRSMEDIREEFAARPRALSWALRDLPSKSIDPAWMCESAKMSEENRLRMQWLIDNDEYNLPNHMRPECHQAGTTYNANYGRMRWDAPAGTLTTGFATPGRGRFVHPLEPRTLTNREAARVQAIPDWFDLAPGGRAPKVTDLRRWIGNAVPPILAHAAVSALPLGSFPAE